MIQMKKAASRPETNEKSGFVPTGLSYSADRSLAIRKDSQPTWTCRILKNQNVS